MINPSALLRRILSQMGGAALLLSLAGCAGVSYRAIETPAQDLAARGLRYYDSSPYILVQTDNQGDLKSELTYLPDMGKLRHAKPYNFLASNSTTLEFQKAIVTSASNDSDSTAVPVSIVSALKTAAVEGAKLAAFDRSSGGIAKPASGPARVPKVYLFKVVKRPVVDPKTGRSSLEWGLIGAEGGPIQYKPE